MRQARLVCDAPDSLRDENRYLERIFHKNIYNADFNRRNIYRPTEADSTKRNPTPVSTVTVNTLRAILRPSHGSYSHKIICKAFGFSGGGAVQCLGSSPGRGHYVVFFGKTLNSHSASLHPGV